MQLNGSGKREHTPQVTGGLVLRVALAALPRRGATPGPAKLLRAMRGAREVWRAPEQEQERGGGGAAAEATHEADA